MKSATVLSDRAVGLLAVASAVAVANAYYIQPLLVEVGEALLHLQWDHSDGPRQILTRRR